MPIYLKLVNLKSCEQECEFRRKNIKDTYQSTRKLKLLTVCSCHVTYAFQSNSTLYSCLSFKKLLVRSRREIWSLSDFNLTRTQNHFVRKRTLNHFTQLNKFRLRTKWFWVRVQLQSTKASSILKLKPLNAYLHLAIFQFTFSFSLPLQHSTRWSKNRV